MRIWELLAALVGYETTAVRESQKSAYGRAYDALFNAVTAINQLEIDGLQVLMQSDTAKEKTTIRLRFPFSLVRGDMDLLPDLDNLLGKSWKAMSAENHSLVYAGAIDLKITPERAEKVVAFAAGLVAQVTAQKDGIAALIAEHHKPVEAEIPPAPAPTVRLGKSTCRLIASTGKVEAPVAAAAVIERPKGRLTRLLPAEHGAKSQPDANGNERV